MRAMTEQPGEYRSDISKVYVSIERVGLARDCFWCERPAKRWVIQLYHVPDVQKFLLSSLASLFLGKMEEKFTNYPVCEKCLCTFLRAHMTIPSELQFDLASLLSRMACGELLWLCFAGKPEEVADVVFRWPASVECREDLFPTIIQSMEEDPESPFIGRG